MAGYGSQNRGSSRLPDSAIFVIMPAISGPILCLGSGFGLLQNVFGGESNSWAGLLGGGAAGVVLLAVAAGGG